MYPECGSEGSEIRSTRFSFLKHKSDVYEKMDFQERAVKRTQHGICTVDGNQWTRKKRHIGTIEGGRGSKRCRVGLNKISIESEMSVNGATQLGRYRYDGATELNVECSRLVTKVKGGKRGCVWCMSLDLRICVCRVLRGYACCEFRLEKLKTDDQKKLKGSKFVQFFDKSEIVKSRVEGEWV